MLEIEVGRKEKEAGKEPKKMARQQKKDLQEQVEKEWAQMKERHTADVEMWSAKCSKLVPGGTKKKDLPPKPKLGKKLQVLAINDGDDDEGDEVEEEPVDDEA